MPGRPKHRVTSSESQSIRPNACQRRPLYRREPKMGEQNHSRSVRRAFSARHNPYPRPQAPSTPAKQSASSTPSTPTSIFSRVKALFTPLKRETPQDGEQLSEEHHNDVASDVKSSVPLHSFSKSIFSYPSPTISRPFETPSTKGFNRRDIEIPSEEAASPSSPNQILADFFRKKGTEPLSDIEAAGVISLVQSINKAPHDSLLSASPPFKPLEDHPVITKDGLLSTPGGSIGSSEEPSSTNTPNQIPQYRPLSTSDSRSHTTLPKITPKKVHFFPTTGSKQVARNLSTDTSKLTNTPPVKLSPNASPFPLPKLSDISRVQGQKEEKLNNRQQTPSSDSKAIPPNSPAIKLSASSPLTRKSPVYSPQGHGSSVIKSNLTSTHLDKYRPAHSSNLRTSIIPSPATSPKAPKSGNFSNSLQTPKTQSHHAANSPFVNLTPTWAVPDFIDDDDEVFSAPPTNFVVISPSKPLYPRIKPPPLSKNSASQPFKLVMSAAETPTNSNSPPNNLDNNCSGGLLMNGSKKMAIPLKGSFAGSPTEKSSCEESNEKHLIIPSSSKSITSDHFSNNVSNSDFDSFSMSLTFPLAEIAKPPTYPASSQSELFKSEFDF